MDRFLGMMGAPFILMGMLLIAWPIKRWLQLHMRESWLKRLLLDRRGDSVTAWFQRMDDKFYRFIRWPFGR